MKIREDNRVVLTIDEYNKILGLIESEAEHWGDVFQLAMSLENKQQTAEVAKKLFRYGSVRRVLLEAGGRSGL